jgi:hypothetical protein
LACLQHKALRSSNIIWQAIKAGISQPHLLLPDQCLDGIEACSRKLKGLQTHAHGLRKVHLRNCLIQAQDGGNKERYKGILKTIERECKVNMALKYQHVKAHQDAIKPWSMLTLEEQLHVICDELAKKAVLRYLSDATPEGRGVQLLPLEKVAVVVNGEKLTTNVGQEVRYALGHKEAQKFYSETIKMKGSANTGGLGWSEYRFEQVALKPIDDALWNKPDMFQIWHAKQCIGVCATRSRMARIQDILDSKCPNCKQEQEKSHHLNKCPDHGRTLLFRESIANLVHWMHEHNHTDAELAYRIEKYLVFRGTCTLTHLV